VTAVVGGREAGFDGFNRALDARRPIGSLVKPFVYLAALETGRYNAASIIQDVPVNIKIPGGRIGAGEFRARHQRPSDGEGPGRSLNLATST